MQALLRAPRASLILSLVACAGVLIFGLAVGVLMQPAVQLVGMERTSELVCLQLAFTPERAAEVVLGFPETARTGIAQLLVPGDLALAWGYGLLLDRFNGVARYAFAATLVKHWRNRDVGAAAGYRTGLH